VVLHLFTGHFTSPSFVELHLIPDQFHHAVPIYRDRGSSSGGFGELMGVC
jgi:hypothetical protein